ncbi:MAG: efflux RND transporter periplasmic adaptor subunit [Ectothiorhodospira sp.]
MRERGLRWWVMAVVLCLPPGAWAAEDLETEAARLRVLPMEQVLNGQVEAVNQATVSAQTSGRVTEVLYDVDDYVESGDLLLRLRDTEQQARLEQAEGALREARARFEEARAEYLRVMGIFERQLISRSEMDRATAALESSQARLESARAALEEAREQLEYTRVRAPYAGIVTERHVEEGETVNPGQPLMSGLSLETLRVVAQVPQRLINDVRAHEQARILLQDGRSLEAAALTFFPYADPRSATFRVRVRLPEEVPGLFPGMLVKVAFRVDEAQYLVVPASAVVQRSELSAVYVVEEDGEIRLRQVRPGRRMNGGDVEILAGLEPGERVALDPVAAGLALKEQREAAR